MAGDWIKMECSTPDKPEVLAITARMGWDDPDFTVGKLFRIWRWFDQQTTDGNAPGVTTALLDRISGVTGFADAMASVGWLQASKDGITLPGFEKHCGRTAKDRAQTANRVANHKSNAKANAPTVSLALPREEKRREEKKKEARKAPDKPDEVADQVWEDFQAIRKSKRAPLTETALEGIKREALKARLSLNDTLALCCKRGWQGFDAEWVGPPGKVVQTTAWAGAK